MFIFSLLIGIYSYCIFFLGIFGYLYRPIIIVFTLAYICAIILWKRKLITRFFTNYVNKKHLQAFFHSLLPQKLFSIFLLLFLLQVIVNLIGTLGPELSFDALWYHLTLPKIFLLNHKISYVPGGLLYYSPMPKVAEMLYLGGLAFSNEILAKLIHFSFGLLTCVVIYKLSRKFFNPLIAMITVVIFYSNLVVAWESITAYIDLVRTFFEILALYLFIDWYQTKKQKFLVQAAIVLGLAITTKVLALGSLIILLLLFGHVYIANITKVGKKISIFSFVCLLIPLPWFTFSFLTTGNPVYPFFSNLYAVPFSWSLFNPVVFITTICNLFTHASDPISPIYLLLLPLLILYFSKFKKEVKMICLYSALAILVWYFTPNTGGGRFILPYLPAFSIVTGGIINELKNARLKEYVMCLLIFVAIVSIGYRFAANAKYIPVLVGRETKTDFLAKHLNFAYGDFADTDGYFASHIKQTDTVLLIGFHNLYYVDFPFIDSSWLQPGERFNYIATQHTTLPQEYRNWRKVYANGLTGVQLYSK